jgi:hypothetical protein
MKLLPYGKVYFLEDTNGKYRPADITDIILYTTFDSVTRVYVYCS